MPSSLALAWVTAHLRRRGLCCDAVVPESTLRSTDVAPKKRTEKCSSFAALPPPLTGECALPREKFLAAVGHRPIPGVENNPDFQTKGGQAVAAGNGDGGGSGAGGFAHLPRPTPQRVVSGVESFVKQQAESAGVTSGPAQVCFLLHTVLAACVRHALRYSRSDHPQGNFSGVVWTDCGEVSNGNVDGESAATSKEATANSHVGFLWSRSVASEHLLEVMRHSSVQKKMRSFLWKALDKEHKRIVHDAIVLCSDKPALQAANIVLDEADVRQMFGIPTDIVSAARESFSAPVASISSSPADQFLSLLSERHFAFTTTSAPLATLLRAEIGGSKQTIEQQVGTTNKNKVVEDCLSLQKTFGRKLLFLLIDMARVRVTVALLLQFELLARRYAAFDKQLTQNTATELSPTSPLAVPSSSSLFLSLLAQDLCAMAIASGSSTLSTRHHRKRFAKEFCISVKAPKKEKSADGNVGTEAPYLTLKSVFAALSSVASLPAAVVNDKNKFTEVVSSPPLSSAASLFASEGTLKSAKVDEALLDGDPLMQVLMSTMPSKAGKTLKKTKNKAVKKKTENGESHRVADTSFCSCVNTLQISSSSSSALFPPSATAERSVVVVDAEKANLSQVTNKSDNQEEAAISRWHFRCCKVKTVSSFDVLNCAPCDENEMKVQLLRPSRNVPWPFVLLADPIDDCSRQKKNSDVAAAFSESNAPHSLLSPMAGVVVVVVRMRFNDTWSTTEKMLTPLDTQHGVQLRRLLWRCGGRVLMINGCPGEKLRSLTRIAHQSVRLVVRFR